MNILITGGTGFIGSALCEALLANSHSLTILTRQSKQNSQAVTYVTDLSKFSHLNHFDAVINLAGEPIFDQPWHSAQKIKLCQSRFEITQKLVELCQKSESPPTVFLSASATGYYGNLTKISDEQSACQNSFASLLCQEWEAIALKAQSEKTRICLLRTGMVLDSTGGALKRMLPLYRLGLGGRIGSGKQYWAWIALTDQVRAILFLLQHKEAKGAINLVAPTPITNAAFTQQLARKLKRPAFFNIPQWAITLMLGERASLLLDNQPLIPQKLSTLGFSFHYPTLADFLAEQSW